MVASDVRGKLPGRKPHGAVFIKELQGRVQDFDGSEIVMVELIDDPQQTMDLDLPICREGAKISVTGEKNAAGVTFSKREGKAIMDG